MLELLTHPEGELALFNMFTAFGTPQDITLASLRVDHRFAAGQATQAVFKAQVVQRARGPRFRTQRSARQMGQHEAAALAISVVELALLGI